MPGDQAARATTWIALKESFALGQLHVRGIDGGQLMLTDDLDNSLANTLPEALYVKHLRLEALSLLRLQGLNLYYQRLTNLGAVVEPDDGQLIQACVMSGDLNGDETVSLLGVSPFVLALTNPTQYSLAYPYLDLITAGDINDDGAVNLLDINPFVALLTGCATYGASQTVPQPAAAWVLLLGAQAIIRRRSPATAHC